MLRKAIKAVPEGNDPLPQKEELGSGQPTMEDVYRRMKLMMSHFEKTRPPIFIIIWYVKKCTRVLL